ncbi:hypothetical protein, partial [Klebsiella pneumoniae]|uniref:hypothetical protein n=1 Tax=Klebsiella pneumoniae TaxID=573 RepID=UPI00272F7636
RQSDGHQGRTAAEINRWLSAQSGSHHLEQNANKIAIYRIKIKTRLLTPICTTPALALWLDNIKNQR